MALASLGLASSASATSSAPTRSAAPAQASVVGITHPNIGIHSDSQFVRYSLTGLSANSASWEIVGPGGWDDGALLYPGLMYNTYYSLFEGAHLGQYTLEPTGAYDANFNSLPQATEHFSVRQSSGAGVSGSRSGNWVYVWGHASFYYVKANYGDGAWQNSGGRYVTVQDYYSGAWHTIGSAYTSNNGWTNYFKRWAPTHRNFRALVSQTARSWQATSGSIYR
jgi:hypothetical protein